MADSSCYLHPELERVVLESTKTWTDLEFSSLPPVGLEGLCNHECYSCCLFWCKLFMLQAHTRNIVCGFFLKIFVSSWKYYPTLKDYEKQQK